MNGLEADLLEVENSCFFKDDTPYIMKGLKYFRQKTCLEISNWLLCARVKFTQRKALDRYKRFIE